MPRKARGCSLKVKRLPLPGGRAVVTCQTPDPAAKPLYYEMHGEHVASPAVAMVNLLK